MLERCLSSLHTCEKRTSKVYTINRDIDSLNIVVSMWEDMLFESKGNVKMANINDLELIGVKIHVLFSAALGPLLERFCNVVDELDRKTAKIVVMSSKNLIDASNRQEDYFANLEDENMCETLCCIYCNIVILLMSAQQKANPGQWLLKRETALIPPGSQMFAQNVVFKSFLDLNKVGRAFRGLGSFNKAISLLMYLSSLKTTSSLSPYKE